MEHQTDMELIPDRRQPCLTVTLPLPIGINGSGRASGAYAIATVRGVPRLVTSRRARQWRNDAILLVAVAAREQGWADPGGPLVLRVERADRHDLDSGLKLLIDAIADGLLIDDQRFGALAVVRFVVGTLAADCVRVVVEGVGEAMP